MVAPEVGNSATQEGGGAGVGAKNCRRIKYAVLYCTM